MTSFKRIILSASVVLMCAAGISAASSSVPVSDLREGDIIFQESNGPQSIAIQKATNSRITHVGIIFKRGSSWQVLEAVQPVKYTPLADFIARGKNDYYSIKRLNERQPKLTTAVIAAMKKNGNAMLGKNYDIYFDWSDKNIYCSELVWKIYKHALGIEIGKLKPMKDFDLSSAEVQMILKERYGRKIPLDAPVISPEAMFSSDLLVTVHESK